MARRVVLSAFVALVICGLSFYLAYFAGLIYASVTGQLNAANTQSIQQSLRQYALPISLGLGSATFVLAFWRSARRSGDSAATQAGNAECSRSRSVSGHN
jgi:TRAP-type C4-dicarboxylate transport system permease small subunit